MTKDDRNPRNVIGIYVQGSSKIRVFRTSEFRLWSRPGTESCRTVGMMTQFCETVAESAQFGKSPAVSR